MGKLLEDFFNDKVNFSNDFDEETKKALRKASKIKERTINNRNLEEEKKESENKINTLRTERKNLLNSRGIETTDKGNPLLIRNYNPNELTIGTKYENKNNTENFQNFQNKVKNDENFSNELNTNIKNMYKELSNKSLINQEINTRKAKEQAEKSGTLEKVLTSPLLGIWNKFSNLTNDDLIYNEDGTVYKTKTYGELLNEANRNNISGVGGFLYDVGNLAGETATQFIPGIGQANYFSDIAMDKYNENIKNGANVGDAFINATGVSIVDYLKQKALGSLGSRASRLESGAEKSLESAFEKGFSNIIGNKSLNKILSGTTAEFLDEFTDSIVEQVWDNVTINKNGAFEGMDNADFWKNALYEGLLGAVTGSAGASIKVASTPKSQRIAEQSIYDIERETGNPLSQNNKNIINNISSVIDMEGNKYTAQDVIDRFNKPREEMVNKFTKDSVDLFPNLDEQHKTQYYQLVNEVAQIMYDTGTDIRFDPNQNTVIDTTGGIITLNPTRTDMPIKNILLHEIAKNIGGQNTQNYVINKLKKDGTYEQRKNELLATGEFDEANVNNEIVAQELDKILSNEEMLKELANKDTNLFNNIKEKIDFLASKLTNGKNTKDAYYLNALYNNFQRDYGISTTPNKDYVSEIKPKEDKSITIEEKPLENAKNGATVDNKGKQLTVKQQEYKKQEVEKEKNKKILSPTEIANLKPEDANMAPELQKRKYNKKGDGESKQVETLLKSNLFTDEQKQRIIADEEFRKYDKITNKESLDKAFEKLKNGGKTETLRWFNNKENADAIDMAEGAILMKMYADNGMNDQMVEVAKKLRDMKTKTGQALQASSILSRMTPEGMVAYAQSELTEAYNELVKTKSKEWVDENKDKFDLTPSDVDFIMDTMEKVSKMEDGYDKKVELAKIQKLMSDKIPPTISKSIKGFMRISMLFNPKTQVRNVLGNTLIAPVNLVGDIASTVADKAIAKKTGVRTTGTADIKSMLKGFKKGAYEATNDFKLGINTKDMNGNRFEIGEGKSFSDKYAIGRGLNKVEHLLNYTMDVGDRVFYESWFENSLANQMALNKVDTPTQEMIDIATTEALQRTWNDNNKYTKFVLDVRKGINSVLGGENYGLGDVLIPFAKTPANLTKAIVDYSPVGMVNALVQGNNLKKAISRGDMTPQQQHKFVQTLGKATAGTMLYILGYALAKTGVLTGKDDEDKDTKNFMKNVLGINQYSVKIGDTSFTYDWAQPISAPFAMMTNLVNSQDKETALLESVVASLDTAGSILLEQSFLQSINDVLTDNSGVVSGLINSVLDLPARAIPTLFKQVADLADPVQRQTFEYGKPLQTAGEKMLVKIPGASKLLAPKVNNMGEDILKYGGKNNVFNVMFNPANVNKENVNEVGQEIYNVYKSTGKKDVMPRVAPYYINKKNGEKIQLSSSQIAEFQKMEGKEIENNIKDIMKNSNYKNLSNEKKAELIKNIVNYAYNLTENKMFGIELSSSYKTVENVKEKGGDIGEYYLYKTQLGEKDSEYTKRKKLRLTNISKKTKSAIYEASVDNDNEKNTYNLYNVLKENNIDINEYLDYLSIEFKGDKDEDGQTISGSKKNKIIDYLNSSNLTYKQKLLIGGKQFTLDDEEQEYIINLILKSKLNKSDKEKLIGSYKGIKIYSDGTARW